MKIYTNPQEEIAQVSEPTKLATPIHIELEYVEEAAMLMALVGSLNGDDSKKLINKFNTKINEDDTKSFSWKFIGELFDNLHDNIHESFYNIDSLLKIKFNID